MSLALPHLPARTVRKVRLITLLVIAWLLWSGVFTPLLLGLGVFSCFLTAYLTRRMGYFDNDVFALRFGFRLLRYWGWLATAIVRSSIDVARIVLDPRLPISPTVIEIDSNSSHPVDLVILANSITLTPGTLALDAHQGIIKVHSLTRAGADELLSGEMGRRVAALRKH